MDPSIANLVPVLDSYWLMIHVSVIVGSYGPFTLGMILGVVSLILMVFLTKKNKEIIKLKPKNVVVFMDTCYSGQSRDEENLFASARPLRILTDNSEGDVPSNFTVFSFRITLFFSSSDIARFFWLTIVVWYIYPAPASTIAIGKSFKVDNIITPA